MFSVAIKSFVLLSVQWTRHPSCTPSVFSVCEKSQILTNYHSPLLPDMLSQDYSILHFLNEIASKILEAALLSNA